MPFHARRPRAPLDRAVTLLWTVTDQPAPTRLERVLPTGTAQLVVNLAEDRTRTYDEDRALACSTTSGSVLSGPRSRYTVIDTDEQVDLVGAIVTPAGLPCLWRGPASDLAEQDVPLDSLWPAREVARLRERLLSAPTPDARLDALEASLGAWLHPAEPHPAVALALDVFHRHPSAARVRDAVARSGFSARYVIDRFKMQVGLAPKPYCRVLRFQQAVRRAHRGALDDWSALAIDCGFADQSHLVREFRAFAGLPPSAYLDRRTSHHNHVRLLDADGTPLDAPDMA